MKQKSKIQFVGNTTRKGNPLWNEYVNTDTGDSTLQEHTPQEVPFCKTKDHYFVVLDGNGNIQCRKCPQGFRLVWGMEFVKNGKIVKKL